MVKSGDVVRVKVLSVDIPRHRISITLRLDDEATKGPRPAGVRPRAGDRASGDSSRTGRGTSPRSGAIGSRPSAKTADGALADALRRAGLATEAPKAPEAPEAPKASGNP